MAFKNSGKSAEELEEERLMRIVNVPREQRKQVSVKAEDNKPVENNTQPQKQWKYQQEGPKPYVAPTTPAPSNPPAEQPLRKYQQNQQQKTKKSWLTGPPVDLSTRVNYLNSLLDQGTINEEDNKPVENNTQPQKQWKYQQEGPKPYVAPTTPAPSNPPAEQPLRKYQQNQQQKTKKSWLTGPPVDLSTRVNYLNSLLDQGTINEEEYHNRSQDLRAISDIVDATMSGDLATLEAKIQENSHIDLNQIMENQSTILHIAADTITGQVGDLANGQGPKLLELLLSNGVEPNSVLGGYSTLLLLCTRPQFPNAAQTIEVLLKHGAKANASIVLKETASNTPPITALACAVTYNAETEVIRTLCKYGADANAKMEDGPVLNYCCINGKTDMAKVLLEARADPNSREPRLGASCLASAIFDGNAELVQLLLRHGADKTQSCVRQGDDHRTPLQLAQVNGNQQIISLLQ
eukprot:TRINITY_DN7863_c0_g1_i1.p1 TRINITY_DN7863_c0_g1~~TRINITY_DN7863_c0_g1_i1.p1  ORF type:complete len:471 (-),score=121.91 TRINITY_DN7863_c0_g1_i1:53-1444(-)